jgi:hypothetical protein
MALRPAARSPRGVIGALILLIGIPLALGVDIAFGSGAEAIVHLTLAATFATISLASFDFKLPAWISVAACAAMAAFALIFALQAAHDVAPSEPLRRLAFDVLGQRPEKLLGCAFVLWCLALLIADSTGATRQFGMVVVAVLVVVEVHSIVLAQSGGQVPGALKLLYVPLFVWLLLESRKPRRGATQT